MLKKNSKVRCIDTTLALYYGDMVIVQITDDSYICKCWKGNLSFDKNEVYLVK